MSQSLMSQSLTSESLLDRFDISSDDLALLKECGRVLGNKIDTVVERFYEWLGAQPEFNVFFKVRTRWSASRSCKRFIGSISSTA